MATMKVAVIPKPGADFQIVEREIPKLGAGHVLIKVQACGVCHSDLFTRRRRLAQNSVSPRSRMRNRGHHR